MTTDVNAFVHMIWSAIASAFAQVSTQQQWGLVGIKVLNVLLPGLFILGSWIAFKFIWNITPEVREKMKAHFESKKADA